MENVDVIIVGAGPAGSNAAIKTAASGLKTLVFEEHKEIGIPVQCGEGVSQQLLDYHKIDYKSGNFIDIHLPHQKFYFAGKNEKTGDWDMQKYTMVSGYKTYLVNRTKFDQMFAKQAMDKGAEYRTLSKVTDVRIDSTGVEVDVHSPNGSSPYTVKGKVIVAADGSASRIARSQGLKIPTKYVHACEWKVEGKWSDTLDFYFDHDLTPYGYSWVFPKENVSKIGLVCRQVYEPAIRLNELMKRMEKQFKTTFKKIELIGGLIPAEEQQPQKTYSNRLLVAGDAGGFTNPFFYGGISISILTGRLAGDTIAEISEKDSNFTEDSLALYQKKWHKEKSFNKVIYEGRNLFYKKFSNKELEIMGDFADYRKVGQVTGLDWFKAKYLTLRAFMNKNIRANWREYKKAVAGMNTSGNWGF